jgi:hypothetical protein
LKTRFCLECKNFEDRGEIDDVVMCARGHDPGVSCPDFQDKSEGLRKIASRTRFCLECKNFEDRGEVDEVVVCARGHSPGVSCADFQDRIVDAFYCYIYWAYLYGTCKTDEGRSYFEERFSRKLSMQELSYACLIEYFELGLDYSDFHKCWKAARRIYEEKTPIISKIFDVASRRFDLYGEKTEFKRVFLDLLFSEKTSEGVIKEVSEGFYKIGSWKDYGKRNRIQRHVGSRY